MSKSLPNSASEPFEAPSPYALDPQPAPTEAPALSDRARPLPRISIQAFCETPDLAEAVHAASEDRRLSKAHVMIQMGGTAAAIAHYQENPTPNLIILETNAPHATLVAELEELGEDKTARAPPMKRLDEPDKTPRQLEEVINSPRAQPIGSERSGKASSKSLFNKK